MRSPDSSLVPPATFAPNDSACSRQTPYCSSSRTVSDGHVPTAVEISLSFRTHILLFWSCSIPEHALHSISWIRNSYETNSEYVIDDSPNDRRSKILFNFLCWCWVHSYEDLVIHSKCLPVAALQCTCLSNRCFFWKHLPLQEILPKLGFCSSYSRRSWFFERYCPTSIGLTTISSLNLLELRRLFWSCYEFRKIKNVSFTGVNVRSRVLALMLSSWCLYKTKSCIVLVASSPFTIHQKPRRIVMWHPVLTVSFFAQHLLDTIFIMSEDFTCNSLAIMQASWRKAPSITFPMNTQAFTKKA